MGKRNLKRNIPVQPVYNKLGHSRVSAILFFNGQTGSEMSGRFAGRTNKVFMACDDDILNALESSPRPIARRIQPVWTIRLPTIHVQSIHQREWLSVVRSSNLTTQLGESIPLTTGSLTMHMQRAHYVAMIWRKAEESHPRLHSPVDCGWEFDTTRHPYAPVRCLNPPAPAAVMNLVKCGCKRGYKRCRNNNIPYTDVCGCANFSCNNNAHSDDLVMREIDGDERVDDDIVYTMCF